MQLVLDPMGAHDAQQLLGEYIGEQEVAHGEAAQARSSGGAR